MVEVGQGGCNSRRSGDLPITSLGSDRDLEMSGKDKPQYVGTGTGGRT
jgi:hypothetical protein